MKTKYVIAACGFETISYTKTLTPALVDFLWARLPAKAFTHVNCEDTHREVSGILQHQTNVQAQGHWTSRNSVCYKLSPPDPPSGPLVAITLPIFNSPYARERRVTDGGSNYYWGGSSEYI
jgi:hypothetical protein